MCIEPCPPTRLSHAKWRSGRCRRAGANALLPQLLHLLLHLHVRRNLHRRRYARPSCRCRCSSVRAAASPALARASNCTRAPIASRPSCFLIVDIYSRLPQSGADHVSLRPVLVGAVDLPLVEVRRDLRLAVCAASAAAAAAASAATLARAARAANAQ